MFEELNLTYVCFQTRVSQSMNQRDVSTIVHAKYVVAQGCPHDYTLHHVKVIRIANINAWEGFPVASQRHVCNEARLK